MSRGNVNEASKTFTVSIVRSSGSSLAEQAGAELQLELCCEPAPALARWAGNIMPLGELERRRQMHALPLVPALADSHSCQRGRDVTDYAQVTGL